MSNDGASRFFSSIPWDRFKGAHYSFAAVRRGEALENLAYRIVLDSVGPDPKWTFETKIEELQIVRGWADVVEAKEQLGSLESGWISFGGRKVGFHNLPSTQTYHWSHQRLVDWAKKNTGWPGDELHGSGGQVLASEELARLKRLLNSARSRPLGDWQVVADLLGRPLEIETRFGQQTNGQFHCYVPVQARIERVRSLSGPSRLEIDVESHEPFTQDLEVHVLPIDTRLEPMTIPSSIWRRKSTSSHAVIVAMAPESGPVRVQLAFKGETVDGTVGGVASTLGAAYRTFDEDHERLRTLLAGGKKKSVQDSFVQGVLNLLNLAGASAIDLSRGGGDHFPDFVVRFGKRAVVVGECTTGPLEETKVDGIAGWKQTLESALVGVPDAYVSAVACIPASIDTVHERVRRKAAELRVRILASEDWVEMVSAVSRGETHESIWSIITTPRDLHLYM
jgi:hypothetical protein